MTSALPRAVCQSPAQAPRLPRRGPQASPKGLLESMPNFALPPPELDLTPREKVLTKEPRRVRERVPEKAPSAPRLRPAPSPVFDEPMSDFELPEAADSDDESWSENSSFGHLYIGFAEDISYAEKGYATNNEICNAFMSLKSAKGISECSTAFGEDDIESCPSPVLGWGSDV